MAKSVEAIECKTDTERTVWAAAYGAEFVASGREGGKDLFLCGHSAMCAANAAVETLRESAK